MVYPLTYKIKPIYSLMGFYAWVLYISERGDKQTETSLMPLCLSVPKQQLQSLESLTVKHTQHQFELLDGHKQPGASAITASHLERKKGF